jgi:hypothetical protein
MLKRLGLTIGALTLVMALFTGQALAAHPTLAKNYNNECENLGPSGSTYTIRCSFKITGLGDAVNTATVSLFVQAGCVNPATHKPPGLLQTSSVTVPVTNGNITVNEQSFTFTLSCPPPQEPFVGTTATVLLNGSSVGSIPIS